MYMLVGVGMCVCFCHLILTSMLFQCCLLDVDECASNPCVGHGTCTDGLLQWECSCDEPYFGSSCEHGQYTGVT